VSAELFGECVKVLRTTKGLSVRQLARELGGSPTTVTGIEGGKIKDPRVSILLKWIDHFGMDRGSSLKIFGGEDSRTGESRE
jgi:transcriptional regulator with XRE-family HTH domain